MLFRGAKSFGLMVLTSLTIASCQNIKKSSNLSIHSDETSTDMNDIESIDMEEISSSCSEKELNRPAYCHFYTDATLREWGSNEAYFYTHRQLPLPYKSKKDELVPRGVGSSNSDRGLEYATGNGQTVEEVLEFYPIGVNTPKRNQFLSEQIGRAVEEAADYINAVDVISPEDAEVVWSRIRLIEMRSHRFELGGRVEISSALKGGIGGQIFSGVDASAGLSIEGWVRQLGFSLYSVMENPEDKEKLIRKKFVVNGNYHDLYNFIRLRIKIDARARVNISKALFGKFMPSKVAAYLSKIVKAEFKPNIEYVHQFDQFIDAEDKLPVEGGGALSQLAIDFINNVFFPTCEILKKENCDGLKVRKLVDDL
ncbi:MAG: hypothetical protein R3B45_07805 [Bdellovibrionota bacterium]